MTSPVASLAMYPFVAVRPHYRQLWDAVVERMPGLPTTLDWPSDVHASWADDTAVVKQACGWPLITSLGDSVRVVGAFEHVVPEATGHRYRAAVVTTRSGGPDDVRSAVAAANSVDSLSGWVSLLAWSGRQAAEFRECVEWTGSHVGSLELLQAGHAEIASIDAVTLAHVRRTRPELISGLTIVGFGPLVPTLPVIAPRSVGHEFVVELRRALVGAVGDVSELAREALTINNFVPLDIDDYRRELAGLTAE